MSISHRFHGAVLSGAVMCLTAAPARGAVTLFEGEKGRLEADLRLMVWAVDAGPDPIPGVNPTPPPPQEENIQDFFIRRARLILRAKVSSLEIVAQMGQDNIGSKLLREDSGFRFKDAFINYRKADPLQIAVGQFKVPFLRSNLESGFNQLLVDRSLVTALRPAIEGQRDQGGMIWGSHGGFQYRAAVFDGSDQEDNNAGSSLRGTGRVAWNWFDPEPGFAYTGTTFGEKRTLQIAGQVDAQNDRTEPRDEAAFQAEPRQYRAWAGEFFYEQPLPGDWSLVTEGAWLERRDDYETAGLDTRAIDGAYLQAGCTLPGHVGPGRLQVASRWEQIRTERGDTTTELHATTLGLTWYVRAHERKVQLDYIWIRESPDDLDDNTLRLSMVAMF